MSVLQPRTNFNDKIKDVLYLCQYKEIPIKLVGSSSLQSQEYFGDYDAITLINKQEKPNNIYLEFMDIITKIKKDSELYFIEFKIQTKNNKFKFYKNDKLKFSDIKNNFYETEYYKIDISMWFEYQFIDVSIIYQLFTDETTNEQLIDGLKEEIKELMKDGKYYKVLKRKFSIYKLEGNIKKMSELTKIFNSELGFKYKIASNLEAMDLVKEHYKDKLTIERIKINLEYLKLYNYNLNDLMKEAKKLKNEINLKAKKLLDNFN